MSFKGNLGNMMKQVQDMQKQLEQAQQEAANAHYEGEAGAGLAKAVANGHGSILRIDLDASLANESLEIIADLAAAAANAAIDKGKKAMASKVSGLTSGLKLPDGLDSLLGGAGG